MRLSRRQLLFSMASSLAMASLPSTNTFAGTRHSIKRIAFGSCAMQSLDQPIWHTVLASDPDLFLFLGDAIYGDFDGKQAFTPTEETLLRDWGKLASQPGFEALRKQVPIMATWDNHDYGSHNGGVEFSLKEASPGDQYLKGRCQRKPLARLKLVG